MPEEDYRKQERETKTRLREGLKAGKTNANLKAEFYDDGETQRHIVDVLTALGVVEDEEGETDAQPQDVPGEATDEPKPQGEPDKAAEPQPHGVLSKTARRVRQGAAVQVARQVADDVTGGNKTLVARHAK